MQTRAVQWVLALQVVAIPRESRTRRWVTQALPVHAVRRRRAELDRVAATLERKFVAGSAVLETLAADSGALLEMSRRLLKYSLGHEDGSSTFQAAIAVIERPLQFNDECLPMTDRVEQDLAAVASRIAKMYRFRSTLDGTIAPLQILQTMFRIESAACCPETQTLFVSLSSEIERLLKRMATMIVREFEGIEATGATVHEAIRRLGEVRQRQLKARGRRANIAASVQQMEAQLEINRVRDIRLVGVTERVSAKVATVVSGLQYQDILTQRLNHIMSGLDDVAEHLSAIETPNGRNSLLFLRDASKIQGAQLEDIEGTLESVIGKLVSALHELGADVGGLSDECVLLNGVESSSAAFDGMVQVLLDTFEENLALVKSTSKQSEEICLVLEPIRGLLGSLTGNILELSAQIRLIALNAQVQAVQAGEGTGLEVLSDHTRTIAEDMARLVTDIARELDALNDELKSAMDYAGDARDQSQNFLSYLETEGAVQENRLHEFRNKMLADLMSVGEQIARVQGEARNMAAALDMGTSSLMSIRALREEMQWFSAELAARLPKDAAGAPMEELAARYTTASERHSHERALGVAGCSPESQTAAEGSVELF